MDKPITVATEDLKKAIVDAINDCKLPAFVIWYVLKDILIEVEKLNQEQMAYDRKAYEDSLGKGDSDE
jgi:hypothetical protein